MLPASFGIDEGADAVAWRGEETTNSQQENAPTSKPFSKLAFICPEHANQARSWLDGMSQHPVGTRHDCFLLCWIMDMANATRYEITLEEVATALVRHLNINEGLWTIGAGFNFTGKNLGTDNKEMRPGFLGVITKMNLVRVTEAVPGLTVDAGLVNPPMAGTMARGRKTN